MKTTKTGKKTTNNATPNNLENSSRRYNSLVDRASKMKTDADATGALIDAEVYRRWSLEPAAMNYAYARKNEDNDEQLLDFSKCSEPFNIGNIIVHTGWQGDAGDCGTVQLCTSFDKDGKPMPTYDREGNVTYLPATRGQIHKIPKEGVDVCTITTTERDLSLYRVFGRSEAPLFGYELWCIDNRPDYYDNPEEMREALTKSYCEQIVSPTKHLEKDKVFPFYSWAYCMFVSYKDWQNYNKLPLDKMVIGTDTLAGFNDSIEFMKWLISVYDEKTPDRYEIPSPEVPDWQMPVIFFDVNDCDGYCQQLVHDMIPVRLDTHRRETNDDQNPQDYIVQYYDLDGWTNGNELGVMGNYAELAARLKGGKMGIDSGKDCVSCCPLIFPEGRVSQDDDVHECMFSELIQNCLELWYIDENKFNSLPQVEGDLLLDTLLEPYRIVNNEYRKNSWYENDYLIEYQRNIIQQDWFFTHIRRTYLYIIVMYGLYSFTKGKVGDSAKARECLAVIETAMGFPIHPSWSIAEYNGTMYSVTLLTRALLGYYHEIYG